MTIKLDYPNGPGKYYFYPSGGGVYFAVVRDGTDAFYVSLFTKYGEVVVLEELVTGLHGYWVRDISEPPEMEVEPSLPKGVTYGGRGPAGEYYSKDINPQANISIWTEDADSEHWTAYELEAIARHKRWLDAQKSSGPQEVEPNWRDKPEVQFGNVYKAWWYSQGNSVLPAFVRQEIGPCYSVTRVIVDGALLKPVADLPGKWHPWNNGVKPTPYVE